MIRTPAQDRRISEINEDDNYISLIGTVVSTDPREYTLLMDDGTGQITIFVEKLYDIGRVLRIIGRPFESGKGLNADIVQDFSNINISIYNKIREWEARR